MPNTEILLIEPVQNLGSEGDIVKVRPGLARNYLFSSKKSRANEFGESQKTRLFKIAKAAREAEELQKAQEFAGKLSNESIAVAVKTVPREVVWFCYCCPSFGKT